MLDDDVLGAGVGQLAEPVDDLRRASRVPAAPSAETRKFWSVERSISSGSRPTAAQCSARIAYLRAIASGDPKTLQASAYWATRRSVFFSPPPPIMIGTLGRDSDCGELSRRVAWNWRPSNVAFGAALTRPHRVGDLERLLEQLEPLAERREREAEAPRLVLVPGGPDAEPGPAAREDVERGRRLDPQARGTGSGRRRPSARVGRAPSGPP